MLGNRALIFAGILLVGAFLLCGTGLVAADPFLISSPAGGNTSIDPAVAYGGGQYLVVWTRDQRINASRVLPDGSVLDPAGIGLPVYSLPPPGGEIGTASQPAVASDGTDFMAAYRVAGLLDLSCIGISSKNVIGVARISQAGVSLDASPATIGSECVSTGDVMHPDIDFDGSRHLAPLDHDAIFGDLVEGALVTPALGITPLTISAQVQFETGVTRPVTAFGAGTHLVAWLDSRFEANRNVYVARVDTAGTVLDPAGIRVSAADSANDDRPAVAFGGSGFLVAWDRGGDLRGARVEPDGTVLDPDGFAIRAGGTQAAVAFDGTSFLVVWVEADAESAVFGAFVTPLGDVGAPFRISDEGADATSPSVAFDGSRLLVVWQRSAGGAVDVYADFVDATPAEWAAASVVGADGHGVSAALPLAALLLLPFAVIAFWRRGGGSPEG